MIDSGAILLGVTNVPEVCMWVESVNSIYGRTCNPYDSRRMCGGSSGGEAALISSCGSVVGIICFFSFSLLLFQEFIFMTL